MKIAKLELRMRRGGGALLVPPKSIKFFTMTNFTRSIQMVNSGSVGLVTYCDLFVLEINGSKRAGARGAIAALSKKNDLVSAEVTLTDHSGGLYTEGVQFGWDDDALSVNSMENPFQDVYISKPGNLYLVISSISKVEDYFDKELIDKEEWAKETYQRVSLGA